MARVSTLVFTHPNPRAQALQERGAAVLTGLMLLSAAAACLLAFSNPRLILMLGVGVALLALAAPVLLLTAASPAVEITDEALILRPFVWRRRAVPWAAVRALKPHLLLPIPEGESVRRFLAGRRKYQAARGTLIVIPALPLQYRVLGLFTGEGFTGAIAITSRTHRDYDQALAAIEARLAQAAESGQC